MTIQFVRLGRHKTLANMHVPCWEKISGIGTDRLQTIEVLKDKVKHSEDYLDRLKHNLNELETCKAIHLTDDYTHQMLGGQVKGWKQ